MSADTVNVPRADLEGVILLAEVAHSMTNAPDVRKLAMKKIHAARRALAASTPVGGWEDISTAPKDGTVVDVWAFWPESKEYRRTPDAFWEADAGDWQLGQYNRFQYVHKPDVTHWMPLPPPPSVSTGSRPQEAVPTEQADGAVVAHSTYLSAVAGRMAFRDAFRRCLPVVKAAEALAAKWSREGQNVDSDDFYAAINDVWEAVAKRNGDPLAKDDGAYAATLPPADDCSSNEGAG